ncbi:hypothetical protein FCF10_00960 [Lactobacillus amylovorus subsp. animalium]|uniref:phage head spike fiber domain-containing protein n=1 Tax=Lactobacillus amylovorus TaxID=1604 RepID=UPI0010ACC1D8|nr:carbohydrate binding domain-containing protein [Lactobacillus amylovorus]TJY06239.1 hypothetical protein FCF10_00960 [Lactobacillus amylovorus]
MRLFGGGEEFAKKKDVVNPNLFVGSKDFTGNWINMALVQQKDKYLDFTAICNVRPWNGIAQYIVVNKGDTFTASAYVKADAGFSFRWYVTLNADGEAGYKKVDVNPSSAAINGTGNWQKTSITFTVTGDSGAIKPRLEGDGSKSFWVAGMKLERGTVATPWCPAYSDYAMKSDLDALRAEIEQLKQK